MTIAAETAGDHKQPQKRRVCFSFAAYAKSVVEHLLSAGVPVTAGLSDLEFTSIEASFGFEFPPDLRSILHEGLPVGAGFPNWRSSSPNQLRLLLSLPIAGILNEISKNNLWPQSFGLRPATTSECIAKAKSILSKAPVLVPIYRSFYIPSSSPTVNGNPIFYVRGGCVRCSAFDLADFFRRFGSKWRVEGEAEVPMPAWAAKSARGVETWSDLVGDVEEAGRGTWRWKEMGWRLREGGWREEEVREMMGMDGDDGGVDRMVLRDRDSVMCHVRLLALALLRAGWSTEDVVYCMGSTAKEDKDKDKDKDKEKEMERESQVMTWQLEPAGSEISIELWEKA